MRRALTAIALVVLVGAAALALDAGQLYLNRARIVNALDSSVLAGVQYLPDHPDLALETASEYAARNGLKSEEYDFEIAESNRP
jgi:Flp pilus assembly protein TadG